LTLTKGPRRRSTKDSRVVGKGKGPGERIITAGRKKKEECAKRLEDGSSFKCVLGREQIGDLRGSGLEKDYRHGAPSRLKTWSRYRHNTENRPDLSNRAR